MRGWGNGAANEVISPEFQIQVQAEPPRAELWMAIALFSVGAIITSVETELIEEFSWKGPGGRGTDNKGYGRPWRCGRP